MSKSTLTARGSKDIVQKVMLGKNEIFADVLNGFIFKGQQVIKPDMLTDTNTTSYYKANGEIHGQDQDGQAHGGAGDELRCRGLPLPAHQEQNALPRAYAGGILRERSLELQPKPAWKH